MSHQAHNPELYVGRVVGNGECAVFVERVSNCGVTSGWRAGQRVHDAHLGTIARGTIIATMVDGHYPNHKHGNHAAVYMSHDAHGIQVIDQWHGQPVHHRTIWWRGGHGSPSNDGDAFYVID